MRYPLLAGVFGTAYWASLQLPVRFFSKFTNRREGLHHDTYQGSSDLVGRFRIFDSQKIESAEDKLLDHLAMYDKDPLSKPELVDHMMKRISEQTDLTEVFRIKRQGKDASDIFWQFGKIHGLENIAFADAEDLAEVKGNPYELQKLVNKIDPANVPGHSSYQQVESDIHRDLQNFKEAVGKLNLYPSDRKKLLAMPFYLAKRAEAPVPRHG